MGFVGIGAALVGLPPLIGGLLAGTAVKVQPCKAPPQMTETHKYLVGQ